jgi:serine/threonine protein kinase
VGQTIGRYKVLEKLGSGGMGDVFKAEDSKLGRPVALKLLASHLLRDEEAVKRFQREARAAAALSHPNITTIYEIDQDQDKTFLALEYIEGETLEERIAKGPLPLPEALEIAQQIAAGLEAAHAAGVVHRDIKPGNVLVTPDRRVKILDFGLALLTEGSKLTQLDTTVGTVAYMSPEQAQGGDIDHRTDIWALGCLLYEMVTSERPFPGVHDQALLYEIVNQAPEPLTGVRAGVPMELEFVVSKCLAKDREDRHGSAEEVAKDLRTLCERLKSGRSTISPTANLIAGVRPAVASASAPKPAEALPPDSVIVKNSSQRVLRAMLAAATLAILVLSFLYFTQAPPETLEPPTRRFSFSQEGLSAASISPDGRYIAFAVGTAPESSLWLRALGSETPREIPGTKGARPILAAWSPDSKYIVFATTTEIKRVDINGGDPVTLGDSPIVFFGASWSPDGERIVLTAGSGVLRDIPSRGGESKLLLEDHAGGARWPHFLPMADGSEAVLYEAGSRIWVLDLDSSERREIGPGSAPVYSREGYLIYGSGDAGESGLRAVPFSLATLQPSGEAFPIAETGEFASVARDGTLVYSTGTGSGIETLVWRDRAGEVLETIGQPQRDIERPALAPDDEWIAVNSREGGVLEIWISDLQRSTKTRLASLGQGLQRNPDWSPSGQEVVYQSQTDQGYCLMRARADGTGEPVVLVESANATRAPAWSRDGRYLFYYEADPQMGSEIRYIEFGADGAAGEPVTFHSSPANERDPRLSPDGRFLTYISDESGRAEIYVQPFPDGSWKLQASVNGGIDPRWSPVGDELYYVTDAGLMAVSVSAEQEFRLGQPQLLFEDPSLSTGGAGVMYDVSRDGRRFVTVAAFEGEDETVVPSVRIVENWYEEFRERE